MKTPQLRAIVEFDAAEFAPAQAGAAKAYDPDQPRDELGRFGQTSNPVGRESEDALDKVAELATSGATAHSFRRVSTSADMSPYDGTDADVQAVHTYETPQYRNIADELRYGRDKGAAADIVALDRLMESGALGTRTTKDVVVLRGLSSIPGRPNTEAMVNELKAAPPGFAFEDNSFCSTTVDPSISERFGSRPDRETALVKVLVPKGSRAVYSNWSGESELILDRGGRFVVAGHERGPGGEHIINVIHAERMVKDKAPVGAKSAKAQDAQDAQDVDRFAWSASQIVILRSLGPLERSRAAQGDA